MVPSSLVGARCRAPKGSVFNIMLGYAPTAKPWITYILNTFEFELPSLRLSVAGGILQKRFIDRYGYEPDEYSVFVGPVEVILYKCFDHDMDLVSEALTGSDIDREGLLRLRSSNREAAAAA